MANKLPANTLMMALRVAPSVWASLHQAVKETDDPSVMLWQGMAKTHSDGPINPGLFARANYDDHSGPAVSDDEIIKIAKALRNPSSVIHVFNSAAGEHANDRHLAAMSVLSHLVENFKNKGGARAVVFHMLYDSAGRNDKVHRVETVGPDGQPIRISEHNTPFGIFNPIILRRLGVDFLTSIDPHSHLTVENYQRAFHNDSTATLTNISAIADEIIKKHHDAILAGNFRLGAPDGWDKKDNAMENRATERIKEVAHIIWENMPTLAQKHTTFDEFLNHIQFGITKTRKAEYTGGPAKAQVTGFHGNVEDCVCVLVDDLSDTGGSLIQSGKALKSNGAIRVDAGICHGPPHEETLKKILNATMLADNATGIIIDNLVITNTMARVEGFYNALDAEGKRRVTMINTGDVLVDHLTHPVPVRLREPAESLLRGVNLG